MLIIEKVQPDIAENMGTGPHSEDSLCEYRKDGFRVGFTISSSVLGGRVTGMTTSWQ